MIVKTNYEENKQIIEEVERLIAYSMTVETKYSTNFLFNLGRTAPYGKSTISKMYQRVRLIYWEEISKDIFSSKNKDNQKKSLLLSNIKIYIL